MDITTDAVRNYIATRRRAQESIISGLVKRLNDGFSDIHGADLGDLQQMHRAHHIFKAQTNWISQLGEAFAKYEALAYLEDDFTPMGQ
jgi:hypothetical protein